MAGEMRPAFAPVKTGSAERAFGARICFEVDAEVAEELPSAVRDNSGIMEQTHLTYRRPQESDKPPLNIASPLDLAFPENPHIPHSGG